MAWWRLVTARLRGLLFRNRVDREIEEELQFHVRMLAEENERRGMAPEDAKRAAARRFGSPERIMLYCRDVKGGGVVESAIEDLRFGLRVLGKNPGFAAASILTLAVGIGAGTAVFSVVNAVLVKPLPYTEPDRLVRAYWRWPRGEGNTISTAHYEFWRQHTTSFEDATAYSLTGSGFNLVGAGEPQRVRGLRVAESFFRVIGTGPALGRGFLPEEDRPGAPQVAVITDGLWRTAFGADPSVVGRQIRLNGVSCTVVGVLPPGFTFEEPFDVLTPLGLVVNPRDNGHNTSMIARLAPGVLIEAAQEEVDRLLPPLRETYPTHVGPNDRGLRLVPYHEHVVGDTASTLFVLFAAVGLVLLVACANVASLLLSRGADRAGEMAIRAALGAGRLRLARQVLIESLLLAGIGGALGVAVAYWCLPALVALAPAGLPRVDEIGVDMSVLGFAVLLSAGTSVLFGLAPAFQAARLDIERTLRGSAGRNVAASGTARSALVVAEVAVSLVLLAGAALLVESFVNLRAVQLGFDPYDLQTMQVSLNSAEYKTTTRAWELERRVAEEIEAIPGVVSAAAVTSLPMERGLNNFLRVEGRPDGDGLSVECRPVSAGYFATLGVPLLSGRTLSDADTADAPAVVVLNATLARRFWPDGDPVGAFVRVDGVRRQVVGVVGDIKEMGLDQPVQPTFYYPLAQVSDAQNAAMNVWFLTSWIVRTSGPVDAGAAMREALRRADPSLPVARIRPMTEVLSSSIAARRFVLTLMAIFAGLAVALTSVGLYGVLSYHVSQRKKEIGVRLALGATPGDIVRMVARRGLGLTLVGLVLGLASALALTRYVAHLLFEVSATDPVALGATAALLVAVALAACIVPARRATRVDPLTALRYD